MNVVFSKYIIAVFLISKFNYGNIKIKILYIFILVFKQRIRATQTIGRPY